MTGKVGTFQPEGQVLRRHGQSEPGSFRILSLSWLVLALALLAIPFNRGGLWDPYELRIAELARRLAHQMFGADATLPGAEQVAYVTARQIGQGELSVTSPALGFAVFGVADWAGRVSSMFWGTVAMLSLWMVMGRLVGRIAQVMSVLLLATVPLFAWQSRTLLGDAATMGTLALSTSGLLLACFDRRGTLEQRGWRWQLLFWSMASVGLGAGILCRGILVGVSVPTLSVGLVVLLRRAAPRTLMTRQLSAVLLIGIGLVSAVLGVREAVFAPRGFSLLLGAMLSAAPQPSPFDTALSNLLHQGFPLSAFLPVACATALKRPRSTKETSDHEQTVALVLAFTAVLCLATSSVMETRGVAVPFPAIVALAGLSGLAVARLHRQDGTSALAGAVVLTVAVLLFADFVNLPDKILLTTGVVGARFPESFGREDQLWLRVATATLVSGCVFVAMSGGSSNVRTVGTRAKYRALFQRIHSAFSGRLMSGLVLVETALVTTGLLQHAHDRGWIAVPVFDSVRTFAGPLLNWAWVVPPLVLFVAPVTYTTMQVVERWLTAPGWGARRFGAGKIATLVAALGNRRPHLDQARLSSGLLLGVTLVVSGLVMSVGHAPAMAEQVSPKRAIHQYLSHAGPDEPLALLGIKPESAGYYLGAMPKTFQDVAAAVEWLQPSGAQRRWLAFGSEHLAQLNAAFRAASAGRNLAMVDALASNVLLATNRLQASERDFNPLSVDILTQAPATAHRGSTEFGNVLRLIGWDIKSASGASVASLRAGQPYELKFVFQVLGTTNIDWQVFVHLDGRGKRHNGDHDPVVGRYPTTLWQPGDVVVDCHKLVLERGALPGPHALFFGLFRGNRRLEVTGGSHEDNRVKLGELEVE